MISPNAINFQPNPDSTGQTSRGIWAGLWPTLTSTVQGGGRTAAAQMAGDPWVWILAIGIVILVLDILPSRKKGKK